jgi:hypothetical protein
MTTYHIGTALIALLLAGGCGMEGPVPSEPKPVPVTPQAAANTGASKTVANTKPADSRPVAAAPSGAAASTPTPETPSRIPSHALPTAAAATESQPGMVREKAQVGMGEKGRGYGTGLLAVTLKAYWNAKEMLALNEIKHAMDLYKANEGQYPKTQEEFMQKIIKDGHIKLPLLPAGHRYVYDPTSEEFLMIEAPQMGNDPP